jgi:hypothetical protein
MAMFTIPIYHDYGKVGVGGQLWSVDIPTTNSKGLPIDSAIAIAFTLEQIDIVHNMCEFLELEVELELELEFELPTAVSIVSSSIDIIYIFLVGSRQLNLVVPVRTKPFYLRCGRSCAVGWDGMGWDATTTAVRWRRWWTCRIAI